MDVAQQLEKNESNGRMLELMEGSNDSLRTIEDAQDGQVDAILGLMSSMENSQVDTLNEFKSLSQTLKSSAKASKQPVAETLDDALDEADENSEDLLYQNTLTTRGIEELVQLQKAQESDIGKTSSLSGKSEESNEEKGGLMDMLGFFSPKLFMGKFKGFIKKINPINLMKGGLSDIIKGAGKGLLKGGFKGILKGGAKLLGPIATIGMAVWDFADGLTNADKIVGKSREQMNDLELAGAGIASAISGLTFGLISAETIYGGLETATSTISGIGSDFYNMLPEGVQNTLSGIGDIMFGEDGLLRPFADSFSKILNSIADGNFIDAIFEIVMAVPKQIIGLITNAGKHIFSALPTSWQNTITEIIQPILDGVGYLGTVVMEKFNSIKDKLLGGNILGGIYEAVTAVPTMLAGVLGDLGSKLFSFLPSTMQDTITSMQAGLSEKLSGIVSFVTELIPQPIMELFNGVKSTMEGVIGFINGFIDKAIGKVTDILPDWAKSGISSLFGSKKEVKAKEDNDGNVIPIGAGNSDSSTTPIELALAKNRKDVSAQLASKRVDVGDMMAKNRLAVKEMQAKRKAMAKNGNDFQPSLRVVKQETLTGSQHSDLSRRVAEGRERLKTNTKGSARSTSSAPQGNSAIKASQTFNRSMVSKPAPAPAPIIVQAPPQKSSNAGVVRRTSVDDLGVALINSNAMDG